MSETIIKTAETSVRSRIALRAKIITLGVAVLVVVAVVALVLYNYTKTPQVIPPHLTASQQSDYLATKGDYKGAQKSVATTIDKTTNPTTKTGLYLDQATIAMNAHNYSDAKKYAQAAESLQPTANTAGLLGDIAAQTGDKTTAKQYYQTAIARLDKTANNYNTSLQDYQTRSQGIGQ